MLFLYFLLFVYFAALLYTMFYNLGFVLSFVPETLIKPIPKIGLSFLLSLPISFVLLKFGDINKLPLAGFYPAISGFSMWWLSTAKNIRMTASNSLELVRKTALLIIYIGACYIGFYFLGKLAISALSFIFFFD